MLEGNRFEGIAHVGALNAVAEAGFEFPRVAGAPAGTMSRLSVT